MRDHVVTAAEEAAYFSTALSHFELVDKKGKKRKHGPYPALHDVARIIIDQGMRPRGSDEPSSRARGSSQGRAHSDPGQIESCTPDSGHDSISEGHIVCTDLRKKSRLDIEGKKPRTHLTKLNNQHDAVVAKIGAEFVLYEFRHTFATRFGEIVGDPIALATILGHGNLRTVMKYCHPQATHTAKAMERFIANGLPKEIVTSPVN